MLDQAQRKVRFYALMERRPAAREIVRLLVEGRTRKEVAFHLDLSRHTVDWHLRRLYRDLEIVSVVQLTQLWNQ
jgi:DNA-binding CsgD family transcriptional regulator